jgi:biopolymer transport protein ExbD
MAFEQYQFGEQEAQSAEINMAPLIDMVFILLIFFVVTTNFARQTGIDVSKPRAQSVVTQGQKVMMIGITREGSLHVYGRQVGIDMLEGLVAREVANRPDISVVIVADRKAPVESAVTVMDKCTMAGVKRLSIAAERDRS